MYKSIIVAADITKLDRAEKILRRAMSLCDAGGQVTLVNVVEDTPSYLPSDMTADMMLKARLTADQTLVELLARVGGRADIEIRQGAAAHEILGAAEERRADLIVIASHVPDLSNYFIGATADRVVRHAKCSVLIDR